MESSANNSTIPGCDGFDIHVRTWKPRTAIGAIIQVLHGMGEHTGRYARFAAAATDRGYAVVAHDHRGHGEHADPLGHFADSGGWAIAVDDALTINAAIRDRFPEAPVVLLGHSMGSFIAQHVAMHAGNDLDGLILSGSTRPRRAEILPALAIARIEGWRLGPRGESAILHKLGFDAFNRKFAPTRTESDWLSRDPDEVDKYVSDPLCGGPFSCAIWRDLLTGLHTLASDRTLEQIPAALPILITGGAEDPVGGSKGMAELAHHYNQTGHELVSTQIYAGGRHEMLNEINRDEVMRDWLDWIAATSRSSRAD